MGVIPLAVAATPAPVVEDPAHELTELLGIAVAAANIYGRGPTASVDLLLCDGAKLTFDRFGDVAKPSTLSAALVTLTGVYKTFKGPEAGRVAAAVFRLARHYRDASADEAAGEMGYEYLRLAPTQDFDMSDQAERWRAFCDLARVSPAWDVGDNRSAHAIASGSVVLIDRESGTRYVRTGWFRSYVKREVGGLYSPAALAAQMERVGWQRPGSQGRVKATCPTDSRSLVWTFYTVAAGWEQVNE